MCYSSGVVSSQMWLVWDLISIKNSHTYNCSLEMWHCTTLLKHLQNFKLSNKREASTKSYIPLIKSNNNKKSYFQILFVIVISTMWTICQSAVEEILRSTIIARLNITFYTSAIIEQYPGTCTYYQHG